MPPMLELRGGTDPPLRLYQRRVLPLYEQSKLEPTACAAHALGRYELPVLLLYDFGLNWGSVRESNSR